MKKISKILSLFFIKAVRFYQLFISPIFPNSCRFYPSCSNYSIEAVKKFGFFEGLILSIWRILRCGPWSKGGFDPPKPIFKRNKLCKKTKKEF
ncbi:MAG: membrane protein insertion efficiency factor YidD [Desulfurella sp.]